MMTDDRDELFRANAESARRNLERYAPAKWVEADIGKPVPCETCGKPGRVMRGWPSLGADSPIIAACAEHEPEDDYA